MTRSELVKKIKACRLYDAYHNPTDEIDRGKPEGVNATGQATDRMFALKRLIKVATTRETDFPPELRNDADELRELIQTGVVTLFAEADDGTITAEAFLEVFKPLAGMTEGMLTALNHDDPEKMMSLRSMKTECADKAFYRQLRKSLREDASGRENMFAFGKALSSFGTHLFINAEKGGHLPTGLVEEVNDLVSALNKKASRGDFSFEAVLDQVRAWGLVEGAGMAPAKSGGMPSNSSKQFSGLAKGGRKTPDHQPGTAQTKGPSDDDTDYKASGGQKSKVTPPQLDQSPGNPDDVADGKDAKQDGKWMDGGVSNTIDGVKSNIVEFTVRVPKNRGMMEWNIRVGGRLVGEASKRVFLGGSRHEATIEAAKLSSHLKESEGIRVEAGNIFELQTKVVKRINELAASLGIEARCTIGR